jgi:uncharacterized protein
VDAAFGRPDPLGVGIQYNPEILSWVPFHELEVDFYEILLDPIMGPLDSPYLFTPGALAKMNEIRRLRPLLAHSNYGCEFGFMPLTQTPAVRRHVPMTQQLGSPWIADHCFYGDHSWSDIWSSPLQFSRTEMHRVADRARTLQQLYGVPLAHENATYYAPAPGSDLAEAEFMAGLVEEAGTYLHLDLHNLYANSLNLKNYDAFGYLDSIPLDRVIAVHIAGGSWYRGLYHDWHDSPVPEPVWELLSWLLRRVRPAAVTLEYQGQCHHAATRVLSGESDLEMIIADLARARGIWDTATTPRK